ncbi:MAG: hypothetical protein ABI374_12730, partial [Ginsengibacter sp.]
MQISLLRGSHGSGIEISVFPASFFRKRPMLSNYSYVIFLLISSFSIVFLAADNLIALFFST